MPTLRLLAGRPHGFERRIMLKFSIGACMRLVFEIPLKCHAVEERPGGVRSNDTPMHLRKVAWL